MFAASVLSAVSMTEAQVFLRLGVPREVWAGHTQPGQYVELVVGDIDSWHGTIANRPGRETFDFLVKDVGERSHLIASLRKGDQLMISAPEGEGFPLNAHRRRDIVLAACGVAICAMRAVVEEILLARDDWWRVRLFYGERHADRFAFLEEIEAWRRESIDVYLTASRPSEGTAWRGQVGYVQDHLLEIRPDLANAVAFLAGKDAMIAGFAQMLGRLGMPLNQVFLNT